MFVYVQIAELHPSARCVSTLFGRCLERRTGRWLSCGILAENSPKVSGGIWHGRFVLRSTRTYCMLLVMYSESLFESRSSVATDTDVLPMLAIRHSYLIGRETKLVRWNLGRKVRSILRAKNVLFSLMRKSEIVEKHAGCRCPTWIHGWTFPEIANWSRTFSFNQFNLFLRFLFSHNTRIKVGETGSSCYNFHVFKHIMQTKRARLIIFSIRQD